MQSGFFVCFIQCVCQHFEVPQTQTFMSTVGWIAGQIYLYENTIPNTSTEIKKCICRSILRCFGHHTSTSQICDLRRKYYTSFFLKLPVHPAQCSIRCQTTSCSRTSLSPLQPRTRARLAPGTKGRGPGTWRGVSVRASDFADKKRGGAQRDRQRHHHVFLRLQGRRQDGRGAEQGQQGLSPPHRDLLVRSLRRLRDFHSQQVFVLEFVKNHQSTRY